jgi:hypothetical protein
VTEPHMVKVAAGVTEPLMVKVAAGVTEPLVKVAAGVTEPLMVKVVVGKIEPLMVKVMVGALSAFVVKVAGLTEFRLGVALFCCGREQCRFQSNVTVVLQQEVRDSPLQGEAGSSTSTRTCQSCAVRSRSRCGCGEFCCTVEFSRVPGVFFEPRRTCFVGRVPSRRC